MAHGYAPFRVLYAALFFVLAGWGVFAYGFLHGAMMPRLPVGYPTFSPFMYSLDTFMPIIDFYQESHWLPNTHATLGRGVMIYLWLHIGMGWLISTLAVIGFGGLVRKE
jgi:hypothetical protein